MKAIILSAGQGKRLLPLTETRPKCMLPLSGFPVVDWQLRGLAANGISEAVVVTGFASRAVEDHLRRLSIPGLHIRALYNPFYAVADNIASCYVARGEMTGPFLLLNGDTLFDPEVVAALRREASTPVTVTIDRKARYDADDMKVALDGARLVRIGKTLPSETIDGESIGMLLFDAAGAAAFSARLEAILRDPAELKRWYLSVIDELADEGLVGTASIEGLRWCELDFPADLQHAESLTRVWAEAAARSA